MAEQTATLNYPASTINEILGKAHNWGGEVMLYSASPSWSVPISRTNLAKHRMILVSGYCESAGDGDTYNPVFSFMIPTTMIINGGSTDKVSQCFAASNNNYCVFIDMTFRYNPDTGYLYVSSRSKRWMHTAGTGESIDRGGITFVVGI